uniref:Ig-like domain-containing protein n=1 Tax=Poecilia mexicana TaxID=48701 RepID=A0A3B3WZJ5_9TELE
MHYSVTLQFQSVVAAWLPLSVNCQQLTAGKTEEFSSEGSSATLTCSYTKDSANYLFWYRQNPGKHPEFLKSHSPSGGAESLDRMTFKGSKEEMSMTISSAAVTDSAVYYCARASLLPYLPRLESGSGSGSVSGWFPFSAFPSC